jgi:hypothetical protein
MPGLFRRLGDFTIKFAREQVARGQSLLESLGVLERHEIVVEPEAAARDWARLETFDAVSPEVSKLFGDDLIPKDWYIVSDTIWKKGYAYEVHVHGRDRATGQFRSDVFNLASQDELSIAEIEQRTIDTFTAGEEYPYSQISRVRVTGAFASPEKFI